MMNKTWKFKALLLLMLLPLTMAVLFACGGEDTTEYPVCELTVSRQAAIWRLTTERLSFDDTLFTDGGVTALNAILYNATGHINEVESVAEITQIENRAIFDFTQVLTRAQLEQQEIDNAIREFAIYRNSLITQINSTREFMTIEIFSQRVLDEVDEKIFAARNDMFYAETRDQLLEIFDDIMDFIWSVPTIFDEFWYALNQSRNTAIGIVKTHVEALLNFRFTAENLLLIDIIVGDAIYEINEAMTASAIEVILTNALNQLDAVEKLNLTYLELAILDAINFLNLYRLGFDNNHYTAGGVEELDNIIDIAVDLLNEVQYIEEIDVILENAQNALHLVATYSELLVIARAEAITALNTHRKSLDDSFYSAEGLLSLNNIVASGITAINSAVSLTDVESVLALAIFELNSVEVFGYELERIIAELMISINLHYNTLLNDNSFTQDGLADLSRIRAEIIAQIALATTPSFARGYHAYGIAALNGVRTYAQELAIARVNAILQIEVYRQNFNNANFSVIKIQELDSILLTGTARINSVESFAALSVIINEIKNEFNGVLTYAEELAIARQNAHDTLIAHRFTKNNLNYTASGVVALDNIVANFANGLNSLMSLPSISDALQTAVIALDFVPTYAQELAIFRQGRIQALIDHRLSKLTIPYTDDGVAELDIILGQGIATLNSAATFPQVQDQFEAYLTRLDAVLTYAQVLVLTRAQAVQAISNHRNAFSPGAFSSAGNAELNDVLADFIDRINNAIAISAVNMFQVNAITALNSVLTQAQELVYLRVNLRLDLIDARAMFQNVNYSPEGILLLDQHLTAGLAAIDAAITVDGAMGAFNTAIANLNAVPTIGQGAATAQANAIAQLEAHRNSKDDADFSPSGIAQLNSILATGRSTINATNDITAISQALANAMAAMDAVITLSGELDGLRAEAVSALRNFRGTFNDLEYSQVGIDALNNALLQGEIAINLATSQDAINQAVITAQSAMQSVLTAAQEAGYLEDARLDAVAEIEGYRADIDSMLFGPRGVEQLDDITANAVSSIFEADSLSAIQSIVANAKVAMGNVPRFNAEFVAVLNEYALSFDASQYSVAGLAQRAQIVQDFTVLLNGAPDIIVGHEILMQAIYALDSVERLDGLTRREIKDSAINKIIAYRLGFNNNLFSDTGVSTLDWYVQNAIELINAASSEDEIDGIVADVKLNLRAVLTLAQENAIEFLTNYRETFSEYDYDDYAQDIFDEVLERFIANIRTFSCLTTALMAAINEMDAESNRQAFKNNAIQQLNNHRDTFLEELFSVEGNTKLDAILRQAIIDITFSVEEADVLLILSNAIAQMNLVLTLEQEAYIARLIEYRNSFDNADFSVEARNELDTILSAFITNIRTFVDLDAALRLAISQMDAVEDLDGDSRQELKDGFMARLNAFAGQNEYTPANQLLINEILANAQEQIFFAISLTELEQIADDAEYLISQIEYIVIDDEDDTDNG